MKPVKPIGPLNARIALIGEAPGKWEALRGEPFVGAAGQKLDTWLRELGVNRQDLYICNVLDFKPADTAAKNNDLSSVSKAEMEAGITRLHERMAALEDPYVLVPTGNTALKALTGLNGITKYRGSIVSYEDLNGRTIKVIPTLHPASIFYDAHPAWAEKHIRIDWRRIVEESKTREIVVPERHHLVFPTEKEIKQFYTEAKNAEMMSIDIETHNGAILCVGFSYDPSFSLTLPLRDRRMKHNQSYMREWIHRLCSLDTAKVMQNGFYDAYWLWMKEHIWVVNYLWDCKAMHHCLDPVDQHSLAYMQSVYTLEPYHKDEAKDADKKNQYINDIEALHVYCGLDNCVQRELAGTFKGMLEEQGRLEFYMQHYAAMFEPLLHMMIGGIRTASEDRLMRHAQSQARTIEIQDQLTALIGYSIHAKKDLSPKKLAQALYETLKLPKQFKKGTKTADEVALRKLLLYAQEKLRNVNNPRSRNRDPEHWQKVITVLELLLESRGTTKVRAFVDQRKADKDGYLRCELGFTTESGRLESKKNPLGTGQNLQNIDRRARDTFIPDEGHIFLEVDMSQIESRIIFCLTGDEKLIELARTKPWEFDQHTYNASRLFGVPEAEVTKEQRHIGKIAVHGAQRGMRGKRLSENLLKQGTVKTPKECDELVDRYFAEFPALNDYFASIRKKVLTDRYLQNSWGRIWDVRWEWLSDDLYRRAYSFLPQSETADLLNQWGLIPLHDHLSIRQGETPWPRLVMQIHDALLVSTPPQYAFELAVFLQRHLERTRTLTNGVTLSVPVTFKIGRTWKGDYEFNQLPSEEEFSAAVAKLSA